MNGARVKIIERDLMSANAVFRCFVFRFTVGCISSQGHWFQRRRELDDQGIISEPRIMDLLWPERSPFILTSQYISSCLAGQRSMAILYASMGCIGFSGLLSASPGDVRHARCAFVSAAFWQWVKGEDRLNREPYVCTVIADVRRDWSDRFAAASIVFDSPLKELSLSYGYRIRKQVDSIHELFSKKWLLAFRLFSVLTDAETQDIESLHQSFRIAQRSADVPYHNGVCRTLLKQIELMASDQARAVSSRIPDSPAPSTSKAVRPATDPGESTGMRSPLTVFFNYCRKRDKELGILKGRITSEYWDQVKREFDLENAQTQYALQDDIAQAIEERLEIARSTKEFNKAHKREEKIKARPVLQDSEDRVDIQNQIVAYDGARKKPSMWFNSGSTEFHTYGSQSSAIVVPLSADVFTKPLGDLPAHKREQMFYERISGFAADRGKINGTIIYPGPRKKIRNTFSSTMVSTQKAFMGILLAPPLGLKRPAY